MNHGSLLNKSEPDNSFDKDASIISYTTIEQQTLKLRSLSVMDYFNALFSGANSYYSASTLK